MAVPAPAGSLPALRWTHERGPPQRCPLQRPLHPGGLRQRRPGGGGGGGASDLACRTVEPGRPQLGGLLAFQPSAVGGADLGASAGEVHGYPRTLGGGGGGNGPLGRASLPTETFQQLRQAVLTSLDIADNAEHTVDYEEGGAELQEDWLLESCPSVKEVGKSVFEVRPLEGLLLWVSGAGAAGQLGAVHACRAAAC